MGEDVLAFIALLVFIAVIGLGGIVGMIYSQKLGNDVRIEALREAFQVAEEARQTADREGAE